VAACVRLGRRLKVIGDGPQMGRLRRMADTNVKLLGRRSDEEIRVHLARCRALLFCAEEDFGIVPVEAMAAGCPVIAFGRGGATETVVDAQTGLFFEAQTPESIVRAIQRFETMTDAFHPASLYARATEFSGDVFASRISAWIEACMRA
ncbi:MAG: glycosyltransferase, partial [Phycisphaerales bacterium]